MGTRYQNGRRSKYAPQRIVEKAAEAMADPDILSLREDIALVDARLADVLTHCDGRDSAKRWSELEKAYFELEAIHTGEKKIKPEDHATELKKSLLKMKSLVRAGSEERANWAEVIDLIEHRRRLVESEQRRLEKMQQFITTQEALGIITQVLESVKRHVPESRTRELIGQDCARFLDGAAVNKPA